MSTKARLARLERAAAARPDVGLARHWDRVIEKRLAGLERVLTSIPEVYTDRVTEALGGPDGVARVYGVRGPSWLPEDAPALARWVHQRATWGADHPFNPPIPDPTPAALLDLLFAHPGAELNSKRCPGCGVFVPSVPARHVPGVQYEPPQPLTDACPVCGTRVTPPRRC